MSPAPRPPLTTPWQLMLKTTAYLAVCMIVVGGWSSTVVAQPYLNTADGFMTPGSDTAAWGQPGFDRPYDWSSPDTSNTSVFDTRRIASAGSPYQLLNPHVNAPAPDSMRVPYTNVPVPYTNAPVPNVNSGGMERLLDEFQAPSAEAVQGRPRPTAWTWQVLPVGLMYRSYLAGVRESRFASVWNYERDLGWIWDIALGGRVGLIRYGTTNGFHPEGWQLDVEGAGFPRLDMEDENDLVSVDFRCGVPLTYRVGRFQSKFGFYHLSSHMGDEHLETHPGLSRINFSRDCLMLGVGWFFTPALRGYAEADYAFHSDICKEWEFQFGFDYSPAYPTGFEGAPFFAVNGHLRQEVNYGGEFVVQLGWQWRGTGAGHLFRVGAQYFNGKSEQYEFINDSESKVGLGIWYDY